MSAQALSTFNHRQLWSIALPLVIANISTPMLGLVDTAIMGHLSDAGYLGAIALASLIFNFIFWGFGFLRMGTTGIAAQAFGKQNYDEIRAILVRALVVALVIATMILLLQTVIAECSFALLDSSALIEQRARHYFDIRIWSTPASLCNYVIIGLLLAMQNAKGPLIMVVIGNSCNIILDWFLVMRLGMDIAGIALATVSAEYLSLLVGILLLRRQLRLHPGATHRASILNKSAFFAILTINQHIFIRTLCLIFAFAFFTRQSAQFGDIILAANSVLLNFQTFMAYALDGFAHAAEALVGKAVGSRNRRMFAQTVRTATFWSILVAVSFALCYGLFGNVIIDRLTDLERVRAEAYRYLPWLVFAPVISVWCYLLDGVFIGATLSKAMRNTMLFATVCCFLPAWYLLSPYGNHGLWLALMIFLAARGITMALVLMKNYRQITI